MTETPISEMSAAEVAAHPRAALHGVGDDAVLQQLNARERELLARAEAATAWENLAPPVPADDPYIGHAVGQLPEDLVDRLDAAGAGQDPVMMGGARELGAYIARRQPLPASTRARYEHMAMQLQAQATDLVGKDPVTAGNLDAKAAGIYQLLGVLP